MYLVSHFFKIRLPILMREYSLLAEAIHHNSKIRQLLNRISTSMKDYESLVQDNVRVVLPHVPKDLFDAFGHDPAGVTGSTRRMQGWRAVEDIYHRVHRQRQIFKSFLETFEEHMPNDLRPLDQPIEMLEGLLQALKIQREEILSDTETVSELLKAVQEIHGNVKDEYNKTASHVSVVYPQARDFHLPQSHAESSSHHLAVAYCCFGGKLQGPIPTVLGTWHGCFDPASGHRDAVLETVW
jgi:hypothetical protein